MALDIVNVSKGVPQNRAFKLLHLLCVGCSSDNLSPHLSTITTLLSDSTNLCPNPQVLDDMLALIEMLLSKVSISPESPRDRSYPVLNNVENPHDMDNAEFKISKSYQLSKPGDEVPASVQNSARDETDSVITVNNVRGSCPIGNASLVNTMEIGTSENISQYRNSIGANYTEPSYQILKILLYIMGSDSCEVDLNRINSLLTLLALNYSRTNSRNVDNSELCTNEGDRRNSYHIHENSNSSIDTSDIARVSTATSGISQSCIATSGSNNNKCQVAEFLQANTSRLLEECLENCVFWVPDDPLFVTTCSFLRITREFFYSYSFISNNV